MAGRFWTRFVVGRLVRLGVLLPVVACCTFGLLAISPIDPVRAYVGDSIARVGPAQQKLIAEKWGLDQPPLIRFEKWATNVARGDLGTSLVFSQPVAKVLGDRFVASFALMAVAWLLSGMTGFALGLIAGALEGSWVDRIIRLYAFVLASAPTFWIAVLLLVVFSVELGWAPFCCAAPPGMLPDAVGLADRLRHLALPAATLALLGVGPVALHTRDKVREVMASDFAALAFAQGLGRLAVAVRHGMRNAAVPAVTLQFAHIGELFGGSILAETVFAYPGLGQATVLAGTRGDAPLLLGISLAAALFVFWGNTAADLLHRFLDPRQRHAAQAAE
jgi:peptide/nickel transport system permease protein